MDSHRDERRGLQPLKSPLEEGDRGGALASVGTGDAGCCVNGDMEGRQPLNHKDGFAAVLTWMIVEFIA